MCAARRLSVVLALCAGLTACGGDEPPPVTLPPITEAPIPTPTATEDPVPSAATEQSSDGAVEFARFFYEQVAVGFQNQNPDVVAAISLPGCATCENYVDSIQAVRDDGLRVEGGDFDITFAVSPGLENPAAARVDVGWNFTPVTYYDGSGNVVDTGPAVTGVEELVTLNREGSTWRVASVERVRQRS